MKLFNQCPVCSSTSFKAVYNSKWKDSGFQKCSSCALIFQNPQEDFSVTKDRYKEAYFRYESENELNFFNLIRKTLDDFEVFSLLEQGAKILEIGSATGLFLKYMEEKGYDATGIELCKESCEYAEREHGVHIINSTLEASNLPDETFDFIHFSHLIEHLNDPSGFLIEVNRVLKKSGFIVITTPNTSGFFSGYYHENWRCIVDDHLFLFNKHNLMKLLENNGFVVDETKTWGGIPAGKAPVVIKKLADTLVKITGRGDVVSMLAFKKNGFV